MIIIQYFSTSPILTISSEKSYSWASIMSHKKVAPGGSHPHAGHHFGLQN
jgi:hypothetical protein